MKGTGLAVVLSEFSIGDALFLSASVLGFFNTKPSREPGGLSQSKKSLVSKPADYRERAREELFTQSAG